jgi:hypothetical protein
MAIHSISTFTDKFNGGTRPNRFRITASNPVGGAAGGNGLFIDTHCVAATIPESIVGSIPIPFRGRIYKFPGDRVYNDWNVTVLDDTGASRTWYAFHTWSDLFNNHENNTADDKRHISNFCQDLTIEHLDHASDDFLKTVILRNAWPTQVGPITLDMAAGNQLTQFQVSIAYTHYTFLEQNN